MIALVDCNSFFCSCERIFRPELNKVPVLVLSNNDGCVVARTPAVKELGIPMGVPYFKVKELCQKHHVAVFSSNFSLYTDISRRVMSTLSQFSPIMEVYSVDEAFLDLSHLPKNKLHEIGTQIKKIVFQHVGIPVSVGIATTKTMAKLCNNRAKKDPQFNGVCIETAENRNELLAQTAIEDIWGVGRANGPKFYSIGIKSAKDLCDYPNEIKLQKMFSILGRKTQDELRGQMRYPLNEETPPKKQIMCSRSFGKAVHTLAALNESIASFASNACEKLREQNSVAQTISIFYFTSPHKDIPQYQVFKSYKIPCATADTRKVIKIALELAFQTFKSGFSYKKAGVVLSSIYPNDSFQIDLFNPPDTEKDQKLMQVLDHINLRQGPHTLQSASCGTDNHAWAMLRDHKSPRYTTSWNELPEVS